VTLETWALFAITETALCLTPGPAVLLASYGVFSAIRWLGAASLVWLGVTAFVGRSSVLAVTPVTGVSVGRTRMFTRGFLLQAANPKALVFFVALLPQFIDPASSVLTQVAILGVTSVVIEFVVLLASGALAGRLTVVAARPRIQTLANRVAGTMLVTAGVGLLRVERT
jgi:threonine/homoserine/homoserine lactone efflux protein